MAKFVVPDLVKSDVMLPLLRRKDEESHIQEVMDILRPKVKSPLSLEDEKALRQAIKTFRAQIRIKYESSKISRNMDKFLKYESKWLATSFNLPLRLKPLKLPPPRATADHLGRGDTDGGNFRQRSNYCLMCSTELPIGSLAENSFLITSRLAKSICTAMNLKSTTEVNFESNLVDCSLCSGCYDKIIEVNDVVKELEQIQINIQKLAYDMDQIMMSGIETRKKLPFELHGVNERYLTPAEIRQEIIQFRNHDVMEAVDKKAGPTTKIPFTTTTRRSKAGRKSSQVRVSPKGSVTSPTPSRTVLGRNLPPLCVSASFPKRKKQFNGNPSNATSRLLSMKNRLAILRKRNPFVSTRKSRNHIGNPDSPISILHGTENCNSQVATHPSDISTNESSFDVLTQYQVNNVFIEMPKIEAEESLDNSEICGTVFEPLHSFETRTFPEQDITSSSPTFQLWERDQDGELRLVSTVPQDELIGNIILCCNVPDCNYQSSEAGDLLAHASEFHSKNSTPSADMCPTICHKDSEDESDEGLDTNQETVLTTLEPGPRALEDQSSLSLPCPSGHGPSDNGPSIKNVPPKLYCKVPGCKYKTALQERLMGHVLGLHKNDPRPYKCNFQNCTKTYKEFSKLVKHRKSHGIIRKPSRPFLCNQCTKGYMTARELQAHQKSHLSGIEPPTPVSCQICSNMLPSTKALYYHMQTHQPKLFACQSESCSAAFRKQSLLQRHLGKCHPEKFPEFCVESTVICDECGKTLASIQGLKQHMLRGHTPGQKQRKTITKKCYATNCNFTTENFEELKFHRQTHTDLELAPRFQCPRCSKKFNTQLCLKYHERIHDPKFESFECENCGLKGMIGSNRLKHHLSICLGKLNKQFVCNSCKRPFATNKYLIRHQHKYPNCKSREPGPHSIFCPECNKCCSSVNSLNRHVQLLHSSGDKPHKCSHCAKDFSIKMYLTRHLKDSRFCPASKGYRPDLL